MSRRSIIGFVAAALIAPASALAQGGGFPATVRPSATPGTASDQALPTVQGGRGGAVARPVESKITTGRPYSAETVTEVTQVLGDGTRINRRSATRVYRDGEGRTRREMLSDDGSVRSVTISDPVAHTNYSLDPKTKVAYRTSINIVTPTLTMRQKLEVETQTTATATMRGGGGGTGTGTGAGGGGGRGGGVGAVTLPRMPGPDNPNVKKEDLGTQNVEGVNATGTRTTTIIPAGEIGNDKEIRIVSEQWFSDELDVLVMTRHSDPRSGESTYRLRNILRAEPDQNLFTVPADYTIQQRGGRGGGQPQ